MTLGERLRRARQQRGLTQRQLATSIRGTVNQVYEWERGRGMYISTLTKLCRALDITPNELLGWED